MSDILSLIKKAAVEAVRQTKPMELVFATVTQEEDLENDIPLIIQAEQKKPLTRGFFVKNRLLDGLELGDKLVLLQVQGGQKFYILEVLDNDTD